MSFKPSTLPFAEEVAAVDDLAHGLVEGDGLPLVFAPLAGPFEHLDDAVGIIERLDAGLTLGADGALDGGGFSDGGLIRDLGRHGPGTVGVAVDLGHQAVHDLDLDAALGVALLADGVDLVFRQMVDVGIPHVEDEGLPGGRGFGEPQQVTGGGQGPAQEGRST